MQVVCCCASASASAHCRYSTSVYCTVHSHTTTECCRFEGAVKGTERIYCMYIDNRYL